MVPGIKPADRSCPSFYYNMCNYGAIHMILIYHLAWYKQSQYYFRVHHCDRNNMILCQTRTLKLDSWKVLEEFPQWAWISTFINGYFLIYIVPNMHNVWLHHQILWPCMQSLRYTLAILDNHSRHQWPYCTDNWLNSLHTVICIMWVTAPEGSISPWSA